MNHPRRWLAWLAAPTACLVFTSPAYAQPGPDQPSPPPDAQPDPPPAAPPPVDPPPPPATTGTITGTVEALELDAPLAGATVSIIGTAITTTTGDDGRYQLAAPPGPIELRVDVAGFRSVDRAATVTAGTTTTVDFSLTTIPLLGETVFVVGSRTPRTSVETTVPVDVVTAEEIARSGRTETGRILHSLAASYISTPQTIADGSDHVDPASLRGLGPDHVLVLINGKRRHRTALMHVNGTFGRGTVGTDLNAIAVGSIKRIEILRDGAASQYGSDAIAGVINIVTKDATDQTELTAQTGITGSGDGAQFKTSANHGFKIGDKGFVNLTGELLQRGGTNRAGRYTGTVYSEDRELDDQLLAANGLTRDDFKIKMGEASATLGVASFNLELPISSAARFYGFGDLSHRAGTSAGFYRFPKQESQNVPELYPSGFLPQLQSEIDDQAITIGVRRTGTWTVDASLTHGANRFRFEIENSVNASLGTSSPTTFDAGTLAFTQTVANLDVLRKLSTTTLESLSLVAGTEVRVENYQIHAGDEPSYSLGTETYGDPPQPKLPGAQVFPGFQPSNEVDRTRNNMGVYGGVESSVIKGLTLDVGGRFENYSDFGNSMIGKIASLAKLYPGVSIRAAASTGFRAPSLQQLWFSNVSTLFLRDATGARLISHVLTSNNHSPVTKAFGIPKLHEERSINVSGGVALRPRDHLSITADGYFIRLADRIVLTSQFSSANPIVAEILAPFPGVSQAQFFANAVDTDTRGLDVVVDYTTALGDATLGVTAAANFSTTRVKRVKIPSSLQATFSADPAQLRSFFFGRQSENRLEDAVPHQKATLGLRFALHDLSLLARANYYGAVYFKSDDPSRDEVFHGKVLVDTEVSYRATKQLAVTVGADNLLNTFPDRQTKVINISSGLFQYGRGVSQFGQNGGFYYGKVQLSFP